MKGNEREKEIEKNNERGKIQKIYMPNPSHSPIIMRVCGNNVMNLCSHQLLAPQP